MVAVVANEARAATIAAVIDAVRVADRGRRRHHGRAGSVDFGDMYMHMGMYIHTCACSTQSLPFFI